MINVIEPTTIADVDAQPHTPAALSRSAPTTDDLEERGEVVRELEGRAGRRARGADKQSNDQVQNNPSTKDKTPKDGSGNATPKAGDSTEPGEQQVEQQQDSGDSNSGGVNIAAAVSHQLGAQREHGLDR